MKCTLSCANCTPGADCFWCGWEEKERERRIKKVKNGGLTQLTKEQREHLWPNMTAKYLIEIPKKIYGLQMKRGRKRA